VGACNEGFLRSDAILVLTIITDEEEKSSPGDPASWKQSLVDAKPGGEQAIVVLGLIGDNGTPGAICAPFASNAGTGAEPSPRLRAFAESFPAGRVGSVCASDYAPFFSDAVSPIEGACNDFIPPG
jgi:hypothetical protein